MSGGIKFREDKRTTGFRELVASLGGDISDNPPGSFRESGTDCATVTVVLEAPL